MGSAMRKVLIVVVLVLTASIASAQPFPGAVRVNGGWVPCTHPIAINAGRGCTTPVDTPPALVAQPAPVVCSEPVTTLEAGTYYALQGAPSNVILVLATVLNSAGQLLIVSEWVCADVVPAHTPQIWRALAPGVTWQFDRLAAKPACVE